MKRNVEIKARCRQADAVADAAGRLSGSEATVLIQEDTFFRAATGRLKLRVFPDGQGELIWYERPDQEGPKTCRYTISRTDSPETLKEALAGALGVLGIVRKRRRLFLVGQTRVHLDEVEGLGSFMELEVVMQPEQTSAEGEAIARHLMAELGIAADDLVEGAYIDLLLAGETP